MKYYKDDNNQVYAFNSDGSQDVYIPDSLIEISEEEADELRAPSFEQLKESKYNQIRELYERDADAPVDALGVTWNGGFESAIKLDAARRLSDAAKLLMVTYYDVNNVAHEFYLKEALDIVIAVSSAYQVQLSKKQALFIQIANAKDADELALIEW